MSCSPPRGAEVLPWGMLVSRVPHPALRPYVRLVWTTQPQPGPAPAGLRELVLPTGHLHVALRLAGSALRLFRDPQDAQGTVLSHAVVGGARMGFYLRETSPSARCVGFQLQPGGAQALLGVPAYALTGRHTPLELLWGAGAQEWMELLDQVADPRRRLDRLEHLLWQRLARAPALHPAAAQALRALCRGATVEQAVRVAGCSHRHLLTLFRSATGLAPKDFSRVMRLQQVLDSAARRPADAWADLALQAGFSDQAHFSREFRSFCGLTPQAWRRAAPTHPNHVPLPAH